MTDRPSTMNADPQDNPAPRVSVIVPVYNAQRYLHQAMQSVLDQTFEDFELIVIDDGSTDDSWAILQSLAEADPRINARTRPNTGYQVALNEAIALARGAYLARMDADDVCLPKRFAWQVKHLDDHPDCVLVGGQALKIDPDDTPIYQTAVPTEHPDIDAALLAGRHAIWHPGVMMRRAALDQVGGYRTDLTATEDRDLWLKLTEIGQAANLPQNILHYRVHPQNVTFTRRDAAVKELHAIYTEAFARRGLPAANRPKPAAAAANPAGTRAWWAVQATSWGKPRDARRLALKALRLFPLKRQSWAAAAVAFTGPLGRKIARRKTGPMR